MTNQPKSDNELIADALEQKVEANSQSGILSNPDNPAINRALERLKASQNQENPYSGFKNHGSHNTHNTSSW